MFHLFYILTVVAVVCESLSCDTTTCTLAPLPHPCSPPLLEPHTLSLNKYLQLFVQQQRNAIECFASQPGSVSGWEEGEVELPLFLILDTPGQGWANRVRLAGSVLLLAAALAAQTPVVLLWDWQQPRRWDEFWQPLVCGRGSGDREAVCAAALANLEPYLTANALQVVSKGRFGPAGSRPKFPAVIVDDTDVSLAESLRAFAPDGVLRITGYVAFAQDLLNRLVADGSPLAPLLNAACPLRDVYLPLLRPQPLLTDAVDAMLDRFAAATMVVGLQVRVGSGVNFFVPGSTRRVLPSASEAYQSADPLQVATLFSACARSVLEEEPEAVFFVATDNDAVEARLRADLGDERVLVLDFGKREHSGGIGREEQTDAGQLRAMADFYLLGETDAVYRTYWSTFGFTAAARTSVPDLSVPAAVTSGTDASSWTCALPEAPSTPSNRPGAASIEFTNHC